MTIEALSNEIRRFILRRSESERKIKRATEYVARDGVKASEIAKDQRVQLAQAEFDKIDANPAIAALEERFKEIKSISARYAAI
ncbi:MAG: hypothetical protein GX432_00265 [Candidatus Atribacteria bacterium]|nr:hypothetical protein [Candidatus Atribacteria bacterium]